MPTPILHATQKNQIPPLLLPYLTATGSLTAKLEALSGQKLIVNPQFEGRQTLSLNEKKQLDLPLNRSHSAWVREVMLYGQIDDEAWVKARSVFPFISLIGETKQLTNLGTTPIGYVMFGRGGAVMVKRWLTLTPDGWQRTSVYDWQKRKLLISETFLPAFIQKINSI